jgi:hypothetical protein
MKNSKKITREQLKEIQGGGLPGMTRCLDPETCQYRLGFIGSDLNTPCNLLYPICEPRNYFPPVIEGPVIEG